MPNDLTARLKHFVVYWESLSGDEKGEAQVFCDRLFQAFGHAGYEGAGATLEHRVRRKGDSPGTSFADLVWKPRVLIGMKKRGEKLQLHFRQAFDYWVNLVPNRPRYVVLCNFDEFWIYDFDKQIDQPVDIVATRELPKRHLALNFLFPERRDPLFGNDREAVTRDAAPLAEAHAALDAAVRDSYGFAPKTDILVALATLNGECAAEEQRGNAVLGPGLPASVMNRKSFVTRDCIEMPRA